MAQTDKQNTELDETQSLPSASPIHVDPNQMAPNPQEQAAKAVFGAINRMQMTIRDCRKLGAEMQVLFPEIGQRIVNVGNQCEQIEGDLTRAVCERMAKGSA